MSVNEKEKFKCRLWMARKSSFVRRPNGEKVKFSLRFFRHLYSDRFHSHTIYIKSNTFYQMASPLTRIVNQHFEKSSNGFNYDFNKLLIWIIHNSMGIWFVCVCVVCRKGKSTHSMGGNELLWPMNVMNSDNLFGKVLRLKITVLPHVCMCVLCIVLKAVS